MLHIKNLTQVDLDVVETFFAEGLKNVPKAYFSSLDRPLIDKALQTPFSYAAFEEDKLIGVTLATIPGITPNNYGYDLDYSKEQLQQVTQLIAGLVVPTAKAKGVGTQLIAENCAAICRAGFQIILGTIHPENTASIKMVLKNGLVPKKQVLKYGGLPRIIFERFCF
ncbi:MAG: hypothetical protein RLZZ628_1190 [Bacteroidota bacterium]|jgi:hypothetical protein